MGRQKATVMVCDNPECMEAPSITTKEEPAMGYYLGKGTWVDPSGGFLIPAVFACTSDCLEPAINAKIQEALDAV